MFNYRKYFKYVITLIMIISLGANLFFAMELRLLKKNVNNSNSVISSRVESSARATMLSINEMKEKGSKEEMVELQRYVQQLLSTFNNWIDLNQTEDKINEPLMRGLSGLEALRNTIVHHFNNQYSSRGEELTDYDLVVLDKIYDQLDRFLVVYSNIQGRVDEIKDPNTGDGGLDQWARSMEEISRLYRHSRIPNEHPQYIGLDSVLTSVHIMFPEIGNLLESKVVVETINEDVQIQDGVHYYEISYHIDEELAYSIWLDAINGSLRKFEDYVENNSDEVISRQEALNTASNFMKMFTSHEQIIYGVSSITDDATQNIIYSFQFIPMFDDITIISDQVKVNVSSQGGKILKYSSDFDGTAVPIASNIVTIEDIEEKYSEQLLDMEYTGMSIVRSFYTHYKSVVTYNYKPTKKNEVRNLYFDISTGNQVYEAYSVYDPISYVTTEEDYHITD